MKIPSGFVVVALFLLPLFSTGIFSPSPFTPSHSHFTPPIMQSLFCLACSIFFCLLFHSILPPSLILKKLNFRCKGPNDCGICLQSSRLGVLSAYLLCRLYPQLY